MAPDPRPLWTCPKCGALLVTANMWHSCGQYNLDDLFRAQRAAGQTGLRPLARHHPRLRARLHDSQKTRVVFMVRVRFAAAMARKSYLQCSLALPRLRPPAPDQG